MTICQQELVSIFSCPQSSPGQHSKEIHKLFLVFHLNESFQYLFCTCLKVRSRPNVQYYRSPAIDSQVWDLYGQYWVCGCTPLRLLFAGTVCKPHLKESYIRANYFFLLTIYSNSSPFCRYSITRKSCLGVSIIYLERTFTSYNWMIFGCLINFKMWISRETR